MKVITSEYFGPTNRRGSRVIAREPDGKHSVVSWDHSLSPDGNHREAVEVLCKRLGWEGELMGGHTAKGMAWVFVSDYSPRANK